MKPLKFISTFLKSTLQSADHFELSDEVKKQNWDIKFNDLGLFNYNASGFSIDLKDGFHSIMWTDIERLQAYKADLLTTDELCIDIIFDNKMIIVTEETKGWYQFIDKLKSALSLTNDNWETIVLESPFQYNLTTIYERTDRKMPLKSNFYSAIKGSTKEELNYTFQKQGWKIRKSSMKDFEIHNSWAELVLKSDNECLLLHGQVAFHPDNVKMVRQFFDNLQCAYKFEFYDDGQILEHTENGM